MAGPAAPPYFLTHRRLYCRLFCPAGDVGPTAVFDAIVSQTPNTSVLLDIRSPEEKAAQGVPDLPDESKYVQLSFVAVKDGELQERLRDVDGVEAEVRCVREEGEELAPAAGWRLNMQTALPSCPPEPAPHCPPCPASFHPPPTADRHRDCGAEAAQPPADDLHPGHQLLHRSPRGARAHQARVRPACLPRRMLPLLQPASGRACLSISAGPAAAALVGSQPLRLVAPLSTPWLQLQEDVCHHRRRRELGGLAPAHQALQPDAAAAAERGQQPAGGGRRRRRPHSGGAGDGADGLQPGEAAGGCSGCWTMMGSL